MQPLSFSKPTDQRMEDGEHLWSPKPWTIQAKPAFDASQLAFNKHFVQSKKKN